MVYRYITRDLSAMSSSRSFIVTAACQTRSRRRIVQGATEQHAVGGVKGRPSGLLPWSNEMLTDFNTRKGKMPLPERKAAEVSINRHGQYLGPIRHRWSGDQIGDVPSARCA